MAEKETFLWKWNVPHFSLPECFPTTMRQPRDHRLVWVGRDLNDHLVPPPL